MLQSRQNRGSSAATPAAAGVEGAACPGQFQFRSRSAFIWRSPARRAPLGRPRSGSALRWGPGLALVSALDAERRGTGRQRTGWAWSCRHCRPHMRSWAAFRLSVNFSLPSRLRSTSSATVCETVDDFLVRTAGLDLALRPFCCGPLHRFPGRWPDWGFCSRKRRHWRSTMACCSGVNFCSVMAGSKARLAGLPACP